MHIYVHSNTVDSRNQRLYTKLFSYEGHNIVPKHLNPWEHSRRRHKRVRSWLPTTAAVQKTTNVAADDGHSSLRANDSQII